MSKKQIAVIGAPAPVLTPDEKLDLVIEQTKQILAFVTPKIMGGDLVGDNAPKPMRPTKAETSANPGLYYKTADDPLAGSAPNINVIIVFETKKKDDEGNDIHLFTGGTLYEWAKADLPAFLEWYRWSTRSAEVPAGYTLNWDRLHPEQKAILGIR